MGWGNHTRFQVHSDHNREEVGTKVSSIEAIADAPIEAETWTRK